METPRKILDKLVTHKEFLASVKELAEWHGWKVYCVFDQKHYAKRSSKGYPDLTMVRGKRLAYVEVKVGKDKVTEEQQDWHDKLSLVAEVYIWTHSDWQWIEEVLEKEAGQ